MHREGLIVGSCADSFSNLMNASTVRLQYLKNVLGIKSIIVPENYEAKRPVAEEVPAEFSFQTFNKGSVLFLSLFENEKERNYSVDELQLLEKIIVALKLKFEKTDIAKVKTTSQGQLLMELLSKNYSYVFLLGDGIQSFFRSQQNTQFEAGGLKLFSTFHPKDMIQNPDLKKEAWNGFKSIMENLPR